MYRSSGHRILRLVKALLFEHERLSETWLHNTVSQYRDSLVRPSPYWTEEKQEEIRQLIRKAYARRHVNRRWYASMYYHTYPDATNIRLGFMRKRLYVPGERSIDWGWGERPSTQGGQVDLFSQELMPTIRELSVKYN